MSTPQTKEILKAYDDNPDGKLDKQECAQLIRDIDTGATRLTGGRKTSPMDIYDEKVTWVHA